MKKTDEDAPVVPLAANGVLAGAAWARPETCVLSEDGLHSMVGRLLAGERGPEGGQGPTGSIPGEADHQRQKQSGQSSGEEFRGRQGRDQVVGQENRWKVLHAEYTEQSVSASVGLEYSG